MEIVLNFSEKELVVNEDCKFVDLQKKLKKLLGGDLRNWTIAGKQINHQWLYQYFPTITYQEPAKLVWHDTEDLPYKITYGDTVYTDSIVCFSDNPENEETEVQ